MGETSTDLPHPRRNGHGNRQQQQLPAALAAATAGDSGSTKAAPAATVQQQQHQQHRQSNSLSSNSFLAVLDQRLAEAMSWAARLKERLLGKGSSASKRGQPSP